MVFLRLAGAALLPVLFSAVFYTAEKRSRFADLPYWVKQAVIGISFGALAVFSTEFGIHTEDAVLNVRDAAPLAAGLLFGGPSGIIAGLIGGVERWFAAFWGVGEFSRLACSLATIFAGFFGAGIRHFLLDSKRPSWFYALAAGITTEVLHMLILLLTKMGNDLHTAFYVVQTCSMPMILANGISVMLSAWVVARLGKERRFFSRIPEKVKISQTFQVWLLVGVMIAFAVTGFFTASLQAQIAHQNTDELLRTNVQDVQSDIGDATDRHLLSITRDISKELAIRGASAKNSETIFAWLMEEYDVSEINLVDENGKISFSTNPDFIGFDMAQGAQSAEFLQLLDGKKEYVQQYQPTTYDSKIYMKYAGVALAEGGFLQVGYDAARFRSDIDEQVVIAAQNRHIGNNGFILICNDEGIIVSDRDGRAGELVPFLSDDGQYREGVLFQADVYGESAFCMYGRSEGYVIVSVLPEKEALFTRDVAVYLLLFMEVLVFAALFAHIAYLVKKIVVENIQRINRTLAQITGGNLDVTVNVRSNEEFASLSDDINSTVFTLKHYISEAAARIDKELEFAKQIQHSALPSVFPPFPNRKDFSIYATMDTAKEVGGDFYDFYLLGEDKLAFLIADVSGKGIPAAMFMMTAKTLIKSLAESGLPVNEVFTRANAKLCEGNEAGMFVTAWLGILDLRTGLIRYANAGHNQPAIRRKDGRYETLQERPNFVLAGLEGVRYKAFELVLQPGDQLYLYTDGVTEAQNENGELFGENRMLAALNERPLDVESLCRKIKIDVDAFADGADQFDDITMLSIFYNGVEKAPSITVSPSMDTMSEVAAFLEGELEKLEVPMKTATKLLIALDEIYSNIVRYSGASTAEISCGASNRVLTLKFRDNGTPYNPLSAKEPDTTLSAEDRDIGGLGIFMVRKMMENVDYLYKDEHNILTLTMSY